MADGLTGRRGDEGCMAAMPEKWRGRSTVSDTLSKVGYYGCRQRGSVLLDMFCERASVSKASRINALPNWMRHGSRKGMRRAHDGNTDDDVVVTPSRTRA